MKPVLSVLAMVFASSIAFGQDKPTGWYQFRGPGGTGIAVGQKPPTEVGPDKNVKWKVKVPAGFSSPIIVAGKVVLTAFDGGKLYTIAYDEADGKELWRAEAPATKIEAYHKTEGSPAASTPVTDGTRIVSYFGSAGLFCYDLTGKELWKFEMPMAVTAADFGTGTSPILVDGTVVLVRDEKTDPKIIVIDATTGSLKWEKKRQSPTSYCTPIVWDTPTGKQIVSAGYGRMIAYDAKSGDEIWSVAGMPAACCTSPIVVDDTLFFAGWSPGDAEDKEFKMPTFDKFLESDTNKDGKVSREESENSFLKGFFDNNDTDKDGFITRAEWDATLKYISAGKNSAMAIKSGGKGDITKTHVLWKKTKGLPYVPSGIVIGGQLVLVKDGGLVTAYDTKTGSEIYVQERAVAAGRYYASAVAANGNIYFTMLDDGTITVLKAGEKMPEVVVKNPKLGERVAATPAIANDTLFVRTAGHLYAFAEKK